MKNKMYNTKNIKLNNKKETIVYQIKLFKRNFTIF